MCAALLFALAATLAACGREPAPSGAGGITAGEAKALDEAAEMIEAKRLPDEALRAPEPQTASSASASTVP